MFMLKKISLLFFIATASHAQHVIHGKIEHAGTPSTIYVKKFMFNWVIVDSITTEKNEFTFTIPENDDFIYVSANDEKKLSDVKLYNVKGATNILFDAESRELSVKGTALNEGLYLYLSYLRPFEDGLQSLLEAPPHTPAFQYASEEERNTYKAYLANVDLARKRLEQAKFDFILNHKKEAYTKILIEEKLKRDFFEKDFNALKFFYKNLDKSFKESEGGKKLQAFLRDYETVQAGAKASDFVIPDTQSREQSLYKNLGNYTILDFWASWCAPCRKENLHLVTLYEKYKDAGLNIISVSLDAHKDQWLNAIAKDGLTWLQLSNLKHSNDPVTDLYKITSIPRMFLLDRKGTILARDLYGTELEKKLAELIKK